MLAEANDTDATAELCELERAATAAEAALENDRAAQHAAERRLEVQRARLAAVVEQFRAEALTAPSPWGQALAPLAAPDDGASERLAARAEEARRAALQLRDAAVQASRAALDTRQQAIASRELALSNALASADRKLELARALRASEAPRATLPEPEASRAPSAAAPSPRIEQRAHERVRFEARVDLDTDDNFYTGFSTDISEGGLFVGTAHLLPLGSRVELSFSIGDGSPLRLGGTVQWVRDVLDDPRVMPGMGVRFEALPEQARREIHQFMAAREPLFFA